MTREQFERLMDADGYSPQERARWRNMTPKCTADTFHREMQKLGGIIEVEPTAYVTEYAAD